MSTIAIKQTSRFFLRTAAAAALGGVIGAGAALSMYSNKNKSDYDPRSGKSWKYFLGATPALNLASKVDHSKEDYQKVYNAIAKKIEDTVEYDQASGFYGQLTRLAWHSSGTYDKSDNSGGNYGGTMVYSQEAYDPSNNGLANGRDFLLEIHDKFPWLSRGDLWTLGGVCAVQESGGPKIKWRPGRVDTDESKTPPNGRLPDASKDGKYVKDLFARMGFNEQEVVALLGAHCLGRCHTYNSGYDGPWGPSFNMFTNDFFVRLLQDWHVRKWDGPKQYQDDETNSFMMLPTDMALKEESYFVEHVKAYAADQDLFFKDFSAAFSKLLELGIEFPKETTPFEFKTLDEQDL